MVTEAAWRKCRPQSHLPAEDEVNTHSEMCGSEHLRYPLHEQLGAGSPGRVPSDSLLPAVGDLCSGCMSHCATVWVSHQGQQSWLLRPPGCHLASCGLGGTVMAGAAPRVLGAPPASGLACGMGRGGRKGRRQ